MQRAREFFAKHVEPAVLEWRASPLDERLAMNVAVALNQLADHYFHTLAPEDPRRFGAPSVSALRNELGKREAAFSLIRDVADAHKHVKLDRKDRHLTSAGQTVAGNMGWGEAEFGYGTFGGAEELVVTLDSGQKRHFSALVDATFELWTRLLAA
jgi:hypothetical protein